VPDESFSPIVTWDGEIRGAKAWFGALLGVASHSSTEPMPPAGALISQSIGEGGDGYSAPVYVEVITEEPVEYVAPDTTSFPAESEAPVSTETQPYPVQPEADMAETTGVDDIAQVDEDAPASSGPSTNRLGPMTGKLDPDEGPSEPSRFSPDDEPPYVGNTSAQTGPLDPAIAATLATPDEDMPTEDPAAEPATGEQGTTGEVEPQSEHTNSTQMRASTVLAPVARSPIRPVMKGRGWREVVFSVLGLVAVAIILILLMGGLPTPQTNPSPAGPPAATGPSFNQDNAQAGNASSPATALPGATATITNVPQLPAIEPAQTPAVP